MADEKEFETTDEMIDSVTYELLEKSREMEPGTEEHNAVIDSAVKCYNSYIESTKIGMEFVDRDRQRDHEMALKRMDDEMDKRETKKEIAKESIRTGIGVLGVLAVAFLGWANENHPIYPKTLSSQTSRDAKGWISKLLFK